MQLTEFKLREGLNLEGHEEGDILYFVIYDGDSEPVHLAERDAKYLAKAIQLTERIHKERR